MHLVCWQQMLILEVLIHPYLTACGNSMPHRYQRFLLSEHLYYYVSFPSTRSPSKPSFKACSSLVTIGKLGKNIGYERRNNVIDSWLAI